ncbi:hypothetical protein KY284_016753 [Solanum tuberosum]|nr:hypothetical protein KY284_016752 [Solanum tuberosum]KAH0686200.1 hypothetical protein KY284_016753 [Solanum tuberosum]
MASKTSQSSVTLFLSLNLLLFALVSGTNDTGNCGGQQTRVSTNFAMLQFDPGTDGPRGRGLLVHSHKSKCAGN